jgi:hypothetical protein
LSNAILAIIIVLIAIGAIWMSLFSRKHGVKNWWAYMVSVPLLLYWAVVAATGHGRT